MELDEDKISRLSMQTIILRLEKAIVRRFLAVDMRYHTSMLLTTVVRESYSNLTDLEREKSRKIQEAGIISASL